MNIKVGSKRYDVKFYDKIFLDDNASPGACKPQYTELQISKDASRDTARNTIIHELVHAMVDGIELGDCFINWEKKERFILAFSNLLIQVLDDNPELMEEIRDVVTYNIPDR